MSLDQPGIFMPYWAAMEAGLWQRIVGRNKWPEIEATVTGVDRQTAMPFAIAYIDFSYSPPESETEYGSFEVTGDSQLYNYEIGDTFPIRYNPKKPTEYFR
jgi:hypothetical protein